MALRLLSETWRRRLLGSGRRRGLVLVGMVGLMVVAWMAYAWWTRWPVRATLRTPGDTWFLGFSPDSQTVATTDVRGEVTLWDAKTGRRRSRRDVGANGSVAWPWAFSPDGRTFGVGICSITQASPASIAVVNVADGRVRMLPPTRFPGIYNLAFEKDGRTLRAFLTNAQNDLKEVVRWDLTTGKEASRQPLTCPTTTQGFDTAISPDGRFLALAPYSGVRVGIWDVAADREVTRLKNPSTTARLARGLAFSQDARTLVISREDGSFEVWDVPTQRLKSTLPGHRDGYASMGVSLAPDGKSLASTGGFSNPTSLNGTLQLFQAQITSAGKSRPDGEVIVVDLRNGRRLARAPSAIHPHYSPDSRTIATRGRDLRQQLRDNPARGR